MKTWTHQISINLPSEVEDILMSNAEEHLPTLKIEYLGLVVSTGDSVVLVQTNDPLDFYKLGILVNEISNWVENKNKTEHD
jgi:hypothetical protein